MIVKDLADYLVGAGLQVGVCPTNLVRVDAQKLGGSGQARLGANVQGSIGSHLTKAPTLAARA